MLMKEKQIELLGIGATVADREVKCGSRRTFEISSIASVASDGLWAKIICKRDDRCLRGQQ